jgi:phosphoribosylglycinamide formyltransferase-1
MPAEVPEPPAMVILISGSGSNLQALIDAVTSAEIHARIALVVSNVPDAYGLTRAQNAGIATQTIDHRQFASREQFDAALLRALEPLAPELVVLAGFMRILSADFVRRYEGRLLNIHPSLLPRFPGLETHRRALEAGATEHGATVHFVTAELDRGPNIIQGKVPVLPQDTPGTLAARVLQQEHVIYPIAVKWFLEGRLQMRNQQAFLDAQPLPDSGLQLESPVALH